MSSKFIKASKHSKRILFVFRGLGIGGAQKIQAFVANCCLNVGFDVVAVITRRNQIKTINLDDRIPVYTVNYPLYDINFKSIIRKLYIRIIFTLHLRKEILRLKPDLVCSFMTDITRMVHYALGLNKIKLIGAERGNPFKYKKKDLYKYINAFSRCNFVIFQTERAKSAYPKNIQLKSAVIPNPCIPRLAPISVYNGEREKIIFGVGRLNRDKRFDILIQAFNIVHKKHPDWKLIIFGDGELKFKLLQLSNSLNLEEAIHFPGNIPNVFAEAYKYGIFVLSSDNEGIPNVLIEAMSLGIPCISTDCEPGGPALLLKEGERGVLVPTGDIQKMAEVICYYIENPDIANRYGKLGLKVVTEFDPDKIGRKWIEIFEKLLA